MCKFNIYSSVSKKKKENQTNFVEIQIVIDMISPGLGTCGCFPPSTGKTSNLQQSPPLKLGLLGNCMHHKSWWEKRRTMIKLLKGLY